MVNSTVQAFLANQEVRHSFEGAWNSGGGPKKRNTEGQGLSQPVVATLVQVTPMAGTVAPDGSWFSNKHSFGFIHLKWTQHFVHPQRDRLRADPFREHHGGGTCFIRFSLPVILIRENVVVGMAQFGSMDRQLSHKNVEHLGLFAALG